MTIIDRLDKIHPDLISAFLSTGQCDGIPEDVKLFLKQKSNGLQRYTNTNVISAVQPVSFA